MTPYTVDGVEVLRALTPEETEALQGFERGYTDITYRGKKAPKGQRYQAPGNSMPVPVMRWIGERIQKCDDLLKKRGKECA